MTIVLQSYLEDKKAKTVDLSRIANLEDIGKNVLAHTYTITNPTTINTTPDAITDACGGVQIECSGATDVTVTADVPLTANRFFSKCHVKDLGDKVVNDEFSKTAKKWALTEATVMYDKMDTSTDITTEMNADATVTTISDQIGFHVQFLVEKGFSAETIVVGISESLALQLSRDNLKVGDMGVRKDDAPSTIADQFGIADIFKAPTNVLSGNVTGQTLLDTQKVEIRAYVKDYLRPHRYCEDPLKIETISDSNRSNATRIFGEEKFGSLMYDAPNASSVSYKADPTPIL